MVPAHSRKIVRVFSNFTLSDQDLIHISDGFYRHGYPADLIFNQSGKADIVVVVNFAGQLRFAWGRGLRVYKWLMEPEIKNKLSYLFTTRHSRIFWRVFAHNAKAKEPREVEMPPLIPPHVALKPEEELLSKKNRLLSAIGSREEFLPLHRIRTRLLDDLERREKANIDIFGKGRRYIENKSDGLDNYMYSIAVENSTLDNYWTEKISDCYLSLTVPIYFGCPNTNQYFPEESFIRLNWSDLEDGLNSVLESLSEADYLARLPFLLEARRRLESNLSFGYQIGELLAQHQASSRLVRVTRVWDLNTLVHLSLKFLLPTYHFFGRRLRSALSFLPK